MKPRPIRHSDNPTYCMTCSGSMGWYCEDPAHEHVDTVKHSVLHPPSDAPCGGC